MRYLDNYLKLWEGVIQNDSSNRIRGAGLNKRAGNVQLVRNIIFNSTTNTSFRFHGMQEEVYLNSIQDPEFLETLQEFGFDSERIPQFVKKFRSHSTLRKLANRAFSRLQIGPLFGVAGMYSFNIKRNRKREEDDRRLEGELRKEFEEGRLTFWQYRGSLKMAREFLSCYDRYLLSGEPYAEIVIFGLDSRELNIVYRQFIKKVEQQGKE
jgi:hypothetical protein